jgi:AGZA family xanthine/uracil permease-like MFS transporter
VTVVKSLLRVETADAEEGETAPLGREALAGLTTFLAMAYILVVNPSILGEAGMPTGAVFAATAVASAVGCAVMGLLARYPIALAPGLGLNSFFAFTVVLGMGVDWEVALAGVLVSGVLFLILALSGLRQMVVNAIPMPMKLAVGAGIGIFIAFIGAQNAGIVAASDATLVQLGDLGSASALLAILGVIVTVVLLVRGVQAAVFIGLVVTGAAAMIVGVADTPDAVVGPIPSLGPTLGVAITHLTELLRPELAAVVFTMLFVDFFDTAGTLVAVANQAGLLKDGELERGGRALASDSVATVVGSLLGTSTVTSYIESSAGVGVGGRTGVTSLVVGGLFLLALPFEPVVAVVAATPSVTAPALIVVGVLMAAGIGDIEWGRLEIAVPAFVTIVAMPLTFSIATGIALGLILFPVTMAVVGRPREVHPILYALAVISVLYFVFGIV